MTGEWYLAAHGAVAPGVGSLRGEGKEEFAAAMQTLIATGVGAVLGLAYGSVSARFEVRHRPLVVHDPTSKEGVIGVLIDERLRDLLSLHMPLGIVSMGLVRELYVIGPPDSDDPDDYRTESCWLIEPAP